MPLAFCETRKVTTLSLISLAILFLILITTRLELTFLISSENEILSLLPSRTITPFCPSPSKSGSQIAEASTTFSISTVPPKVRKPGLRAYQDRCASIQAQRENCIRPLLVVKKHTFPNLCTTRAQLFETHTGNNPNKTKNQQQRQHNHNIITIS